MPLRVNRIRSTTDERRDILEPPDPDVVANTAAIEALTDGSNADALHTHEWIAYQQVTSTPFTLTGLIEGVNIIGVASPAGAIAINVADTGEPKKFFKIADERDPADQGDITVNVT